MTMPVRTVALIGAVCLTVGWLLASVLTPPVAQLQSRPERQPQATSNQESGFTERLQFRLQRAPQPPAPRRNPFTFGQRARVVTTEASVPEAKTSDAGTVALAPAAVGPVFSLAGIGIAGETRTAILSDGQAVHVVKIGERVGNYQIVELTDGSVTLQDESGLRFILRLR